MIGNDYVLSRRSISYPYVVTTPPAESALNLAQVKNFLKLDMADTSEDFILNMMMTTAISGAELYIKRELINKTITTYRDNFYEAIQLRRASVSVINFIKYITGGVLTTVDPSTYSLQVSNGFPYIILNDNQVWPDPDLIPQCVQIQFVAGYGATPASIPPEIIMGMFNHVSAMYSNRGDSSSDFTGAKSKGLPMNVRSLYEPFKINTVGSYTRNPPYFRGSDA